MNDLQERRYKEIEPMDTVKKLKKILKQNGIEVEERWGKQSSVGTFHLRVCVKDTMIGQNGKGMTKEFAMASGYAEFFERLQNGMMRFRIEDPTEELPFSIAPDEKLLFAEELLKDNNSVLENILHKNCLEKDTKEQKIQFIKDILNENRKSIDRNNYVSLPYYSVKNKDIEYIPDNLYCYLYTSNGMCAGNSPEEAIIEGISEILERYVGFQIYKKRLTLPELPESYIEKFPKVKKMVEKLKKNESYYFRLVDCSLGGKYPVAGLYILKKNTGKFGFKLGAHPDYGIAMERCFTEAAQGRDIYEYAQVSMFDFYAESDNEKKNLTDFMNSDQSNVPYQILDEGTDYEFTEMPDVAGLDNKTILRNLINGILEEGRDILIRDVSVLGFPSFRIVIPGMSESNFDPNATYFNIFVRLQELFKDLRQINTDNISDVVNMIDIMVNKIGCERLALFISLKDEGMLPCESVGMGARYFLSICYIMNSEYEKAAKILEDLSFIAENVIENPLEKIMIKAVYYYASAMDKLGEHQKAMHYIYLLFDKEIADGIDLSFRDRNDVLVKHYGITSDDYVDNDDSYYLPYMKKFREAQKDNVINQMKNSEIFE